MYTDKQKKEAVDFLRWLYPETNILVDFVDIEDKEIKEIRSSYLFKLWVHDKRVSEFKKVFKEEFKKDFRPIYLFVEKIINAIIKKS